MEIIKMTENDLKSLYEFAYPIWKEVYENIIPSGQIDLLTEKYFKYENILKQMKDGMMYFYIYDDNDKIGFTAYKENKDDVYFDKLYLKKEYRRKGISTFVFDFLKKKYDKPITLNVNQNNQNAYHAYLKNGFKVIEKQTIPLANGYVNYDYVMQYKKDNK